MDPVTIGLIGIVVLIVLFLLGMPVAFTMAFVGLIGFCGRQEPGAGLGLLARDLWYTCLELQPHGHPHVRLHGLHSVLRRA